MGYRMGYIRALMGYRIVLSFLKAGVSQDCREAHRTEVFEPLGALVARSPAPPEPGPTPTRPDPARPPRPDQAQITDFFRV